MELMGLNSLRKIFDNLKHKNANESAHTHKWTTSTADTSGYYHSCNCGATLVLTLCINKIFPYFPTRREIIIELVKDALRK